MAGLLLSISGCTLLQGISILGVGLTLLLPTFNKEDKVIDFLFAQTGGTKPLDQASMFLLVQIYLSFSSLTDKVAFIPVSASGSPTERAPALPT